jgi:hypothetical protein
MQCRDVRRTPRLLENKAEELHIFGRAGDNTIGRVLKKKLKLHLGQRRVIPLEADRACVAAMQDVPAVYTPPCDPGRALGCLDEATKRLIKETREPVPMKPGQPARFDKQIVIAEISAREENRNLHHTRAGRPFAADDGRRQTRPLVPFILNDRP